MLFRMLDRALTQIYILGMGKNLSTAIFLIVMIATIVAVDILFFRHQFRERLAANVGLVLVFLAFYFRFLK